MSKKFPEIYGTRKFIALFTTVRQRPGDIEQQFTVTHTIRQTEISP